MTQQPSGVRAARPTMKDVAALAGVGIKTVSRVVNGEKHVSDETREVVERAISQLRFQRNTSAASLRNGSSSTIALILEDISEPIQATIAHAVEDVARRQGSLVFTASSSGDPQHERDLSESFIARRVDGLIIVPSPADHGYLQSELTGGLPIVFADRPPQGLVADTVLSANRDGALMGVRHLIERGHRRIAFIGNVESVHTGRDRLAGYRDALAQASIPYDDRLVHLGEPNSSRSEAALSAVLTLDEPATALFTGNSLNTIATLRAANFPSGLEHVAFDDHELFDLLAHPMTVVAQDPAVIGETAARRLFDRLEGLTDPATVTELPTQLVIR
ncbi:MULTISPECIES: LacI family DNA-binding transcriptional regulator [Bacteria]